MSQPASPTRLNRNATFAAAVPIRMSDAMAMIAPAPAQTPSIAAMIGCGQARIAFTTSPVILVKSSSSVVAHLGQRLDDLEHVAAGAEVAARAGDDDGLDLLVLRRGAEQVDDLGVAVEGQRILLVGPVERQRRDLAVDREAHVARPGSPTAAASPDWPRSSARSVLRAPCGPTILVLASSGISDSTVARRKIGENLADPVGVVPRHGAEEAPPLGGQADDLHAAVVRRRPAADQALRRPAGRPGR